jgi:hypothetical protein
VVGVGVGGVLKTDAEVVLSGNHQDVLGVQKVADYE